MDLDEAWSFLNVAQGKTLANKLVRAGRAMNAAVYFVTQNAADLADESLKNNIGLKFAFRSTDIAEIKKTLEFFGLDTGDENSQKRLRNLRNTVIPVSYTHLVQAVHDLPADTVYPVPRQPVPPVVYIKIKLVIFQRVAAVLVRCVHGILHQPCRARGRAERLSLIHI